MSEYIALTRDKIRERSWLKFMKRRGLPVTRPFPQLMSIVNQTQWAYMLDLDRMQESEINGLAHLVAEHFRVSVSDAMTQILSDGMPLIATGDIYIVDVTLTSQKQ